MIVCCYGIPKESWVSKGICLCLQSSGPLAGTLPTRFHRKTSPRSAGEAAGCWNRPGPVAVSPVIFKSLKVCSIEQPQHWGSLSILGSLKVLVSKRVCTTFLAGGYRRSPVMPYNIPPIVKNAGTRNGMADLFDEIGLVKR